jgi:hypothetical protein
VILLDTLLVSPLVFVLRRIADAVEAELDDEQALREELLAVEMRRELGELDAAEAAELEEALLARLREARARARGGLPPGTVKVTGVEASVWGEPPAPGRPARGRRRR